MWPPVDFLCVATTASKVWVEIGGAKQRSFFAALHCCSSIAVTKGSKMHHFGVCAGTASWDWRPAPRVSLGDPGSASRGTWGRCVCGTGGGSCQWRQLWCSVTGTFPWAAPPLLPDWGTGSLGLCEFPTHVPQSRLLLKGRGRTERWVCESSYFQFHSWFWLFLHFLQTKSSCLNFKGVILFSQKVWGKLEKTFERNEDSKYEEISLENSPV